MAEKRKVFAIFIASLLLSLACQLGAAPAAGEPAPEATAASGVCDNPLMPVRLGASWTYSNTGSPSGDFSYTDTITDVRADGFTLTMRFDGGSRTQEWSCEPNGLKALQPGGGPTAGVTTNDMTAEFQSLEASGVSIPKTVTPGMQWEHFLKMEGTTAMPGDSDAKSAGTFAASMQEAGRETVTVPAGTFEAVKFQYVSTVMIVAEFQGLQIPFEFSESGFSWFVPGVGYVKSIGNSNAGGEAFTFTTELLSYNIP